MYRGVNRHNNAINIRLFFFFFLLLDIWNLLQFWYLAHFVWFWMFVPNGLEQKKEREKNGGSLSLGRSLIFPGDRSTRCLDCLMVMYPRCLACSDVSYILQETIPLFIFKLNIPLGYYIAATWDCISPTWIPAKTDTSLLLDSNLISPNWRMNRPPCSTRAHTYGNVTSLSMWPAEPPRLGSPWWVLRKRLDAFLWAHLSAKAKECVFYSPSMRHPIAYGASFDSAPFYAPRCIWDRPSTVPNPDVGAGIDFG